MAKTVTIKNAEIVSIVLNEVTNSDGTKAISSNVNYRLMDDSGNFVASPHSSKFTINSERADADKLSSDSTNTVQTFWDEIESLMNGKEGL